MHHYSRPQGPVLALVAVLLAALGSPVQGSRAQRTLTAKKEAHENQSLSNAVTVVVNFNMHNQVNLEVVQTLHSAYSAVFHRVVFTGQDRPDGLDRAISWSSCEFEWTFFSLCLAYTMAEHPESREGGYIFIGDDSIMDPCHMASLNLSKFWTPQPHLVPNERETRDTSAWFWWTRKGALSDRQDGIEANGSAALEAALEDVPSFYKSRGRDIHGEQYIDRDGHFRLVVDHYPQDFLYVPALHAADWLHLAHHFVRYGVMAEVAMPQIIYLLGGLDGMEHPPTYNLIDHDWQTWPPHGGDKVTDQEASQLLRHGSGIFLPPGWINPEAVAPLNTTSMTFMHAYKMSHFVRRHLFLRWWFSLPCLG